MAIVTISRELASLGDETAQELAKLSGARFVDKHCLEERMAALGMSSDKMGKYDERKPGLFAALSADRDEYLHYLKTAIIEEALSITGAGAHAIFIGRGAFAIFAGFPALISALLVSEAGVRVERVKSYFHCDERRAKQIIAQSDENRLGFHRYFFETDWKNPENYTLALNTGILSPQNCAAIINDALARFATPDAEAKNNAHLRFLALSQKIVEHVLYEKKVGIHFFDASVASAGGDGADVVHLYGVAASQTLVELAIAAAREVSGGREVKAEIQVVQDYSILP